MFHKYYEDGIISPDFISKNSNPMEFVGTIASGTTGVFFGETNMVPNENISEWLTSCSGILCSDDVC